MPTSAINGRAYPDTLAPRWLRGSLQPGARDANGDLILTPGYYEHLHQPISSLVNCNRASGAFCALPTLASPKGQ